MNEIIYLDAAASMQKPEFVIDSQVDFMRYHYANAGRGICARAGAVDDMVAATRCRVADFIGADASQIVFTAGATDALNRVRRIIDGGHLRVAVSDLDHNSARVPWMMRPDTDIVIIPLDARNNIDIDNLPVADVYVVTAMSNVFGLPQDVAAIVRKIRTISSNAKIVVDACQYVVHEKINASLWDADFICFSGHKIGADTGVGVMYIKNPDVWCADKFGGGMVRRAVGDVIQFVDGATRFEAGTLPLSQIAGLGPAIDWIEQNRPSADLIQYMYDELSQMSKIEMLGVRNASLISFNVQGMHPLDFGAMMGARNVCLRVGNMCAPWAMQVAGVASAGCVRISVGPQNTMDEATRAIEFIRGIVK